MSSEQEQKHSVYSHLHWHRNLVPAMRHTTNTTSVTYYSQEGTDQNTHTHTQTSIRKSEQVASTLNWTFNWIHVEPAATFSSSHLPRNTVLHCLQSTGTFYLQYLQFVLSVFSIKKIINKQAYSHFWPSFTLSHVMEIRYLTAFQCLYSKLFCFSNFLDPFWQ